MRKSSSTLDPMELRERQEEEGVNFANRISRFMEKRDPDPVPRFTGKPGVISYVDEDEVGLMAQHVRHGVRNIAHESMANIASLSNEERFTASYFSEPLTGYTVGYQDPENLEVLINHVAPRVVAGRRLEYKVAVNKEAFYSEIDDERAIGSEFKRVEYRGATAYNKTQNRGLKYRIDLDESAQGILNEQLIVGRLIQRCRRNQWRRATAVMNALTSANNTNVVFSNTGLPVAPQPDELMRVALQGIQLISGIYANRGLIDLKSWNLRKAGYASQLTAGGIASYKSTLQEVGEDLDLTGGFLKAQAIYTSLAGTQANQTGTKAYIWPQIVAFFYGQDNPGLDDPSNVKRFVTPVGDGDFRVFRQQLGPKFVDITVEYYDNILPTATVGCGQLTPS